MKQLVGRKRWVMPEPVLGGPVVAVWRLNFASRMGQAEVTLGCSCAWRNTLVQVNWIEFALLCYPRTLTTGGHMQAAVS